MGSTHLTSTSARCTFYGRPPLRSHWIHETGFTLRSDLASRWSRRFHWNLSWCTFCRTVKSFRNFQLMAEPIRPLLMNKKDGRSDSGRWIENTWTCCCRGVNTTARYFHKEATEGCRTATAGAEDLEDSVSLYCQLTSHPWLVCWAQQLCPRALLVSWTTRKTDTMLQHHLSEGLCSGVFTRWKSIYHLHYCFSCTRCHGWCDVVVASNQQFKQKWIFVPFVAVCV